jgi:phage-related minor tail protein
MANQILARLGIVMTADSAEFKQGMDEGILAVQKFEKEAKRQLSSARKEMQQMEYATKDFGREVTNLEKAQRSLQSGGKYAKLAGSETAQELLFKAAALDKIAAATKKVNSEQMAGFMGQKAAGGGLNAQQKAALGYQTTDIITGLAGGQNPMLVLIQQGGQLRDQFGGFLPLLKAIGSAMTVFNLAVAGTVAVVGGFAYAFYKAGAEQKKFQSDMILTGNYAGVTASSLNMLAAAVANNAKVTIGDSKEIFSTLIASGQFTYKTMGSVGESIALVSRLSGESADVVAKNLMPSFDGTAQSAKRLNDQYHFLTIEQYKFIEQLQYQGKAQEAIVFTADKLNESLKKQTVEVGYLGQAWKYVSTEFSLFINGMIEWGKSDSKFSIAEKLRKELEEAAKAMNDKSLFGQSSSVKAANEKRFNDIKEQYIQAKKDEIKEVINLQEQSDKKAAEQKKIQLYEEAGGLKRALALQEELRKLQIDGEYQQSVIGLTELERIKKESIKRIADYDRDQDKQNRDEKGQFANAHEKLKAQFAINERSRVAQETSKISDVAEEEIRKSQALEENGIEIEKRKLEIRASNILMTDAEYKIALARLQTEQEIEKILLNKKLDPDAKDRRIAEQLNIEKQREGVIQMEENLGNLKATANSVFGNMSEELTNFVLKGKMDFSSFASSVISDIVRIQMRAMVMKATSGFMGLFGGGFASPGGSVSSMQGIGGSFSGSAFQLPMAAGGFTPENVPHLVGENGPELFMPTSAGTIIPNQQMSSMNGQPSVVYNGPYIASMQAIDTQSGIQFLAKNKMTIWSMNQSANRSIPAGR